MGVKVVFGVDSGWVAGSRVVGVKGWLSQRVVG